MDCVPGPHTAAKLTDMLCRINRKVFYVSKVLVVLSPDVEPAPVVDLFKTLHSFRDTAEVDVNFDLPPEGSDRTKLLRWKWFFDVAARRVYRAGTTPKSWTLTTVFGDPSMRRRAGYAGVATKTACLSSIAHAGDYVTTASTCMALQDPDNDRDVRAKYLGYIMRAGGVQHLTVKDQTLTADDVDRITAVYSKTTQEECLEALYEPTWHSRKTRLFDEKNAKKYLATKNEVLGVMTTSHDDIVDVYLAGFGQCGVNRSVISEMPATVPLKPSRLTELDLLFLSRAETVSSVVRLITLVGRPLEKLQLEIEGGRYSLAMLHRIIEACPALRRLSVKPIHPSARDDRTAFPTPALRQPLQALTIELTPGNFTASDGLIGLCRFLANYTSELKEFELFAPQWALPDIAFVPAVNKFFLEDMPQLKTLRVVGFASTFIQTLWSRDRPSSIEILMLETVSWHPDDWTAFCDALSDPTHPLARSVHTLHLKLSGWIDTDRLVTVLEQNSVLFNVAIDCTQIRDRAEYMRRAQATNGRSVAHVKQPLPARHKAAFLSAVAASNVAIEPQHLVSIFDFAATTETRYVRLHLVSTQPQQPFPFF